MCEFQFVFIYMSSQKSASESTYYYAHSNEHKAYEYMIYIDVFVVCVCVCVCEVSKSVSIPTRCPLIKGPHLVRPRHVSEPYEEWVYSVCVWCGGALRWIGPVPSLATPWLMGTQVSRGGRASGCADMSPRPKTSLRPSRGVTKTQIFAREKAYWANKTLGTHFGRFIWQSKRD